MQIIKLIIIGVAGGVLGGMGMGGGTLLIPLLVLFTGMEQQAAQAINLVSFIPMATVALVFHFKNNLVKKKGIFYIIVPALIAAVSSSYLARNLNPELLGRLFGGFLALLGVFTLIQELTKKSDPKNHSDADKTTDTEASIKADQYQQKRDDKKLYHKHKKESFELKRKLKK